MLMYPNLLAALIVHPYRSHTCAGHTHKYCHLCPADLLDELVLDVAVEAHRERNTGALPAALPGPPPPRPQPLDPLPGVKGSTDVFGQVRMFGVLGAGKRMAMVTWL
jgi:hypothetical protein